MYNERLYWLTALLLLLVVMSVGSGMLFIYQQVSYLDSYKDTNLVSESLHTDHALSFCLFEVMYKQTLHTSQSDGDIWQRASKQWENGEKRIYGNGGEVQYRRVVLPFVSISSRLFFLSERPYNIIFVNNQLTVQLPRQLCL